MDVKFKRKSLIPLWIKLFGWIFLILGAAVPIGMIIFPFQNTPSTYEIFGLTSIGSPFGSMALLIQAILLFLSFSAYGILFGKDWGLDACLSNGYFGLIACAITMILSGFTLIRLEPLIQIPYIIKLHKVRKAWKITEG